MTDNTCPKTVPDINLKAPSYDHHHLLMTSTQPLNLKNQNVSGHSLGQPALWHSPSKMHGQYLIDISNLVLSQQKNHQWTCPHAPHISITPLLAIFHTLHVLCCWKENHLLDHLSSNPYGPKTQNSVLTEPNTQAPHRY